MAEHAFMLVGPIGAGKSTLFKHLFGLKEDVHKTQALEYENSGCIDSPGEFFSYPRLYYALINTASDVEMLVYVHPANERDFRMPPGLLDVYREKNIVGVITKIDLPDADVDFVEELIVTNGIKGPIFKVSCYDEKSIAKVRDFLMAAKKE